jgi:stage II sporulation protein D
MKRSIPTLFLLAFLTGCATPELKEEAFPRETINPTRPVLPAVRHIRVAIVLRQPSVQLVFPENDEHYGLPQSGTPVAEREEDQLRELKLTADKIQGSRAGIIPKDENGEIKVNGENYRGSLEFIREKDGTLSVINDVPLEDYVMGVVAGEVPPQWPLEALRAQAIAARTFALYKQQEARRKGQDYDLENNAFFQMYQGTGRIKDSVRKAVQITKGEVMTYGSSPIMAFFHSNCGGRTSSAKEVWGQDKPYLTSVPCSYGNNGNHFRWTAQIPVAELVRNLRKAGLNISDIVQIRDLSRDESQRITQVGIMDSDGRLKTIKGTLFRLAAGPDIIRSTHFNASIEGNKISFSGKGWGHGVGLCQDGAFGMATKGYNAFEILRYYYHGIMIEKARDNEN